MTIRRIRFLLIVLFLTVACGRMTADGAGEPGAPDNKKGETSMDQTRHDRRIDYIEFQTRDMNVIKKFYSEIFGWKFTDYGPDYSSFEDGRITGGFSLSSEVKTGGSLVVIYSTKLEQIEESIKEHGGRIVKDIFEFPGGRRFHFVDPDGNELAVWSDK